MKCDILKVFEEFYRSGVINGISNKTYICSIPKKLNSCRVRDFRPISLVTSLCKIIANVLAKKLQVVLEILFLNVKGLSWQGGKF